MNPIENFDFEIRTASKRAENSKFSLRGYIAITSAIILSIVLLVVVLTLSLQEFFARENVFEAGRKEFGQAIAESCVETALLKLALDSNYAGNEIISTGNQECAILAIVASGTQKIIKTSATTTQTVTNIKTTVNTSDLSIVSWEEIDDF